MRLAPSLKPITRQHVLEDVLQVCARPLACQHAGLTCAMTLVASGPAFTGQPCQQAPHWP